MSSIFSPVAQRSVQLQGYIENRENKRTARPRIREQESCRQAYCSHQPHRPCESSFSYARWRYPLHEHECCRSQRCKSSAIGIVRATHVSYHALEVSGVVSLSSLHSALGRLLLMWSARSRAEGTYGSLSMSYTIVSIPAFAISPPRQYAPDTLCSTSWLGCRLVVVEGIPLGLEPQRALMSVCLPSCYDCAKIRLEQTMARSLSIRAVSERLEVRFDLTIGLGVRVATWRYMSTSRVMLHTSPSQPHLMDGKQLSLVRHLTS